MTIQQAFQILRKHADWRKGFELQSVPPAELTKAYEVVLAYLDNKLKHVSNA